MLSFLSLARRSLNAAALGLGALVLAACVGGGTAPSGTAGAKLGDVVTVALLVPGGSGQASDELIASGLTNAARLAIADLGATGARIDLKIYNTAASPEQAAAQATKAVSEGAAIILGPVYAQEANAAGVAVAGAGVNVLAFSNNADIAGNNVFILGPTFLNTAKRLGAFAVTQGKGKVLVVKDQNPAGDLGAAAIQAGVTQAGGSVVGTLGYEFSQSGVVAAVPGIVAQAKSTGAQALFLTADTAGALPLITQLLSEGGLPPSTTTYLGLTRWDIPSATLALPGVQGGFFALPDPALYQQFKDRYAGAYGAEPHPIGGLSYDGMAAIGALIQRGGGLGAGDLQQGAGYVGVNGIFRFNADGTNTRALAVAQVQNGKYAIVSPAPRGFGGAGF